MPIGMDWGCVRMFERLAVPQAAREAGGVGMAIRVT